MAKPIKIKVICVECAKKFQVGPNALSPTCPRCGGTDIEVRDA